MCVCVCVCLCLCVCVWLAFLTVCFSVCVLRLGEEKDCVLGCVCVCVGPVI